jgi:hypothetical protein
VEFSVSEKIAIVSLIGGAVWFLVDLYSAYQAGRANDIQERQLATFEEANELTREQAMHGGRVMLHRASSVPARSIVWRFSLWRVLPPVGLFLLALVVSSYDLYERHFGPSRQMAVVDARLAPFASDSHFFTDLPVNTGESFKIICFPFDPMSCNLAARYRDHLADHWTPDGPIMFSYENPATFNGLSILTQSEKRPAAALVLRERFRSVGVEPEFPIANPAQLKLEPNEFALWVGGKP